MDQPLHWLYSANVKEMLSNISLMIWLNMAIPEK